MIERSRSLLVKNVHVLIFCACLLVSLHPFAAFSQPDVRNMVVRADGSAAIGDQGIASARNSAIDDALKNAVEEALGSCVVSYSSSSIEQQQHVETLIDARPRDYVQDYRIIGEKKDDPVLTVTVTATVSLDKIWDVINIKGNAEEGVTGEAEKTVLSTEVSSHYGEVKRCVDSMLRISLTVSGIGSCADFVALRKYLKNDVEAIHAVYERRIELGIAVFDIDAPGGSQLVAAELSAANVAGGLLDISGVTTKTINLTMVR